MAPRPRAAAALAVAAAVLAGCSGGARALTSKDMHPELCADDIGIIVSDLTRIADEIFAMTADCAMPGLDEAACAADVTGFLGNLLDLTGHLNNIAVNCAGSDNICGVTVSHILYDFTMCGRTLIAASVDCVTDPFVCALDTVSAVDLLNTATLDILQALHLCETPFMPYRYAAYDDAEFSDGNQEWNNYRSWRRLQPVAEGEDSQVVLPAAPVPFGMRRVVEAHASVQAELFALIRALPLGAPGHRTSRPRRRDAVGLGWE